MSPHHALLQKLESLQRAGVQTLPKRAAFELPAVEEVYVAPAEPAHEYQPPVRPIVPVAEPAVTSPVRSNFSPAATTVAALPGSSANSLIQVPFPADLPDDLAARENLLTDLRTKVAACRLCNELACTRKQTVFGVGTARPRVVFFGEAPGADEDRMGEPFVGAAGQLLTKIIKACTWERSDVYIMNVLKCRPPGNRNPDPAETANCRPFFERQLEILRPEYIVCVGAVPAQALLETTLSVGKLRGKFYPYRGAKVVVTYHPSYLLRNPDAKRFVWEDMQMLLREMGIELPGKN